MKQTRIPTEPGWYWFEPEALRKRPVEVFALKGELHIKSIQDSSPELVVSVCGRWGERIENKPIEDERICDFCPSKSDLRFCQNCGRDLCRDHRRIVFYRVTQVVLCLSCEETLTTRLKTLFREFGWDGGLR